MLKMISLEQAYRIKKDCLLQDLADYWNGLPSAPLIDKFKEQLIEFINDEVSFYEYEDEKRIKRFIESYEHIQA